MSHSQAYGLPWYLAPRLHSLAAFVCAMTLGVWSVWPVQGPRGIFAWAIVCWWALMVEEITFRRWRGFVAALTRLTWSR